MANTETTINAVINPENNETPIDIEKTIKALERNKFVVHYKGRIRDGINISFRRRRQCKQRN